MSNSITCPLCHDGTMEYREAEGASSVQNENFTPIWVCDACPAVLFEYYDRNNTEALSRSLK